MRSIKYVLLLGVICIVSLGIYVGQVLSFDKTKFVVETKKGDPNEEVVQNMQLRLGEWGQNPNEYVLSTDGNMTKSSQTILSLLFYDESNWTDAPRSFQQFAWRNNTHVFTKDSITYGINRLNENKLELQYWNAQTNKLATLRVKLPEDQMNKQLRFSPFQRTGDKLLIDATPLNRQIEREYIYQIDLKKKSMIKIKLPDRLGKEDTIRSLYSGKMIVDQVKELEYPDDFLNETVVKDGRKTKVLKVFDGVYESSVINNGKYYLGLLEISVNPSSKKKVKWVIYDVESERLITKTIDLKTPTSDKDFSHTSFTINHDHIYFAYRTKKNEVKSLVINPLTSEVIYEANVQKQGSKNDIILNEVTTN